ncbi:hypothetical protein [Variovorax saccharolyticus]|uniref:hypothetical protein n=1 Tax=Variovorax saccharolyticus TaxID=3053516 RepID=UPI00257627D5|nr:hypothetical protein [Variovorax sp. J22R187]MDM0018460.1 hypothetical protein [Variovorax sp. J22R187]
MKSRLRTWLSAGLLRCRWGVLGAGLLGAALAFASSQVDISAPAGPYSLTGFAPGQAMVDCPVQWQKFRNDGGFSCIRHGGKLASRPIQATFLRIESGKLLSVWIDMKNPGDWVHVQSALTQQYGRPAVDQGARREWVAPDAQLSVGNSGGVLLLGSWKARQGAPEAAADL